jgi:hypothetical protein
MFVPEKKEVEFKQTFNITSPLALRSRRAYNGQPRHGPSSTDPRP